ncbi:MAG: B12-binding domain-containing radical SAM protein [Acidobacteriota bacterium]
MNILLYNPDNEVTRNYMPHLWMFLLQSLTPPEHKVFLIDGNAQPMTEAEISQFVRDHHIELAGIGAMTRMAAKAYRMADAIRAAGAKVVMGGPHVTEVPDEPIGRAGEPRHADAVALGEADYLWPRIVEDSARGELKEIYRPVDETGAEIKPGLDQYPEIPWESLDLRQFNLIHKVPAWGQWILRCIGAGWDSFYVVPVESGRGCPYGCDFCTVTGFFGDSIRFRTEESVVNELLRLKAREKAEGGKISVFFIDDNFAINRKRTKSLLRAIIRHDAQVSWIAQVSINLLRDQELVELIASSGGRWIFVGLESIDDANLKGVNKGFNKPAEYRAILENLSEHGIYAITSFIFGMDGDTVGVADKTLEAIESWPPGLPVFGLLTPYPATPLYDRLLAEGRLTRPLHWLDFKPFEMAFTPEKITIADAEAEIHRAWTRCYQPKAIAAALEKIQHRPYHERLILFFSRLVFRGIYFPQMKARHFAGLLWANRRVFASMVADGWTTYRRKRRGGSPAAPVVRAPDTTPAPSE